MKNILFALSVFLFTKADAQQSFPRDTSFNIPATFEKEKKKRPYIIIAEPAISKQVSVKKNIVFKKAGEHALTLDIFYAGKAKKNTPAVLLIFGGGWRSGDKTHNYAMATELARQGFVTVTADYRLSPEATYPAAIIDLKDALRWIRANAQAYSVDKNRIAVLGCSAGGQLAALLGNTNKQLILGGQIVDTTDASVQAIVNIDGTLAFRHPESVEGAVAAQWLGGTYEERPGIWEEAAPLNHVDKNSAPVFFVNSSIPRFHAGRDDMIRKLDSLNIYSQIHTFPDTPHPFWFFHPWFDPMMKEIGGFLRKVFVY
ncbi:MAG: alpha/beta hydrolase [Chitinophagaceae bacterium]